MDNLFICSVFINMAIIFKAKAFRPAGQWRLASALGSFFLYIFSMIKLILFNSYYIFFIINIPIWQAVFLRPVQHFLKKKHLSRQVSAFCRATQPWVKLFPSIIVQRFGFGMHGNYFSDIIVFVQNSWLPLFLLSFYKSMIDFDGFCWLFYFSHA